MLTNRLSTIHAKRRSGDDDGFTLIELLVVVVIIGVLVAIAVPVYLNYRKGAADKSAQSDVRGAVSTIEQFYTDNGNTYPKANILSQTASFSLNTPATAAGTPGWVTLSEKSVVSYVVGASTGTPITSVSTYRVCGKNENGSGKIYVYDSSIGGSVRTVTTLDMATCA